METKTVKAVFVNFLFSLGVVLMVVGFLIGASVGVKKVVFGKYPLNSYEETKCDGVLGPRSVPLEKTEVEMSEKEKEEMEQKCRLALERARKVEFVGDVTTVVSLLLVGGVLVGVFKRQR